MKFLKKVAPFFFKLAGIVGEAINELQDVIINALDKGDFKSILDLINTGLLGGILYGVKKFIDSLSNVTGGVSGILDGVKGSLEALQSSLKAKVLLNIAIAIGIFSCSPFGLSFN